MLIGGSSAFNVVIGVVRTKATALLLGPAGFGLMGLYTSILSLAQSVAGMGVNSSGVRQMAVALGSGDTQRIARTAAVLRRASLALGLTGGLLLVALSRPVSKITFNNYEHTLPVALLSLAVFLAIVSGGQAALIQGLRRISDLAKMSVLGGISGVVFSIALIYLLRERGVVPALIAMNALTLLFSWWFSRRVTLETPVLSASQVVHEVHGLLGLGFAFMASGLLTLGAAYAVRIMIVRQIGLEAAGLYQSAWTIGGIYVGFVLQSMSADFYPRLTAVFSNHEECNRLVNEQAEVSLLLAGPGIIATLTAAPLVIPLLYSGAFHDAVEILRWICLGATFQVITWPIGFIIVAAGRQGVFFGCELAYSMAHVGAAWVFLRAFGVNGAGVAFFASYLFHGVMVYPIARRLTGFRWSAVNRRIGIAFVVLIGLVFCSSYFLPFWLATGLGALAALVNALLSARALVRLVPVDRFPRPIRRLLDWSRIAATKRR